MRGYYGSLNVEEFGSVHEGLLEKDPILHLEQEQKLLFQQLSHLR